MCLGSSCFYTSKPLLADKDYDERRHYISYQMRPTPAPLCDMKHKPKLGSLAV